MAGKFNHRILVISVLSVVALAAAIIIIVVGGKPTPPLPELTMPDGTIVKIEALTFGDTHFFSTDPVRDKLQRFLPRPMRALVGKGVLSATMQTPPNSLVIWMTRVGNPAVALTPPIIAPVSTSRSEMHYIVDSHGCAFQSTQSARLLGGRGWLVGIAFPTFPRGDPTIDYIISDSVNTRTQFRIPNPYKATSKRWTPEELPITKTNGEVVARLSAIQSVAWPQTPFDPEIELIRAPQLELWQKGPVRLFDSVGNCLPAARGAFCTSESVWKVEATFFRGPRAHFPSDEIWRVGGVTIPKKDGINRLQTTKTLHGMEIGLASLRGALYTDPQRDNPSGGQPIPTDGLKLTFWSRRRDAESKLFIRARDDKDRILVVREPVVSSAGVTPGLRENRRFEIYPWADSGTLTLEVIVQEPVRFEFFVRNSYGRKP